MPSFIYEERTARFNIYLSRIPRSAAIIPAGAGLLYTPPTRYLSLYIYLAGIEPGMIHVT